MLQPGNIELQKLYTEANIMTNRQIYGDLAVH